MHRKFECEAHPAISAYLRRKARCRYSLFDSHSEAIRYAQAKGRNSTSLEKALQGDLSRVGESDKFLRKFEAQGVFSSAPCWRDDIAGFVPNVGAYLAGQPTSMRRRAREARPSAPLMITVDLSGSVGLGQSGFHARAAAILALVRILSAQRPVELWLGAHFSTTDSPSQHSGTFLRAQTSPLDLTVVGNLIMDTSLVHDLFHAIGIIDNKSNGGWSFGPPHIEKELQHELLSVAFPKAFETLAIPAAYYGELLSQAPEQWLKAQIQKFAPQLEFAA